MRCKFHNKAMLTDKYGRLHNYLRISLTDVCNFNCTYCMPESVGEWMPAEHLMKPDEIAAIAEVFVRLGVNKIRLTGGEPLLRTDAADVLHMLSKLPVKLTLTTNGSLVHKFTNVFETAGINSLNFSLDSLSADRFKEITKRNYFNKVWDNIHLFIEKGFHVKVNAVIMRGLNDNEITDFIEWTREVPVHIRFIEFMPFSGNKWDVEKVFSYEEMLRLAEKSFSFERLADDKHETAKKFRVEGFKGTFAVISTMSSPFCSSCNRMRLTADGKMKNCLFSRSEVDILSALRRGEDISGLIESCVLSKEEALGGQLSAEYKEIDVSDITNRSMFSIGG